jgi:hypothetical protein
MLLKSKFIKQLENIEKGRDIPIALFCEGDLLEVEVKYDAIHFHDKREHFFRKELLKKKSLCS